MRWRNLLAAASRKFISSLKAIESAKIGISPKPVASSGNGKSGKIGTSRRVCIEPMEHRTLMSTVAHITSSIADNRGRVTLNFDVPLDPSTVNTSSIVVFTAGPDGQLNTADDVQEPITINYDEAANKVVINANLPRNENYRVNVKGSLIQSFH